MDNGLIVTCGVCRGSGYATLAPCPQCNGRGTVRVAPATGQHNIGEGANSANEEMSVAEQMRKDRTRTATEIHERADLMGRLREVRERVEQLKRAKEQADEILADLRVIFGPGAVIASTEWERAHRMINQYFNEHG